MKKGVFSPSKSIIKTDRHTKTTPVIAFFLSMFLTDKFIFFSEAVSQAAGFYILPEFIHPQG